MKSVVISEMIAALASARGGRHRAGVLAHYSRVLQLSVAHLRRIAKAHGVDFGYARRRDAGRYRREDLAAAARAVVDLILASDGDMPTWKAIEVSRRVGAVAADVDIRPWFVDRFMRDNAIERRPSRGPARTAACKWGEPGRVLQVDSTNCAQWFFQEDSGVIRPLLAGEAGTYRNKPASRQKSPPIIRYVAVDPASGCFRLWYYQTAGESADVTLEFLYLAFSRAPHPELMPMWGVPGGIVFDNGPGNKSSAVKNMAAELGIELRPHLPHHAWAKGGVEKTMDVWQRAFESELRLWPAASLADLNERAYQSSIEFCARRIHGRHGMSRSAFFAAHCTEVVAPPPWEIFLEAATSRPVERTVVGGGMLIPYEGREYYVGGIAGVKTGDKVRVSKAVLDWDADTRPVRIRFGDGEAEQCVIERALATDSAGNYLDPRVYERRRDQRLEAAELAQDARVERLRAMPVPRVSLETQQRFEAPAARLTFRPPAALPAYRNLVARLELVKRLGRELTDLEIQSLRWGELVTAAQIDAATQAMAAPPTTAKAAQRTA